ncbi:hypothetical protein NDU88_003786 [Pleurodeles waltl]|uniref:Uncharacterized protein n=1 Tax=Pleurodeles waltl TaxID=8319 RepID=A0AAV7W351_PLEWA|nr:hypothetical protein NDU88_003786 [Pleurodeles waltl]
MGTPAYTRAAVRLRIKAEEVGGQSLEPVDRLCVPGCCCGPVPPAEPRAEPEMETASTLRVPIEIYGIG